MCFLFFARETTGASRIRHSLRPLNFRCALLDAQLARITRRDRGGAGVCTSPRLRGEVEAGRLRVRGTLGASECVEIPPHPDPLPASGAREKWSGRSEVWAKLHDAVIAKSWRDEAIRSSSCSIACASNDRFKMHLAVGNYCDSFPRSPDERSDHPGLPSAIQALGAATAPRAPRWRYRQYRCGHRTPLA